MKDFLACTQTVTVVRHIRDKDTDTYACHVLDGVSWHEKLAVNLSRDGAKPVNVCRVRIPSALLDTDPNALPRKMDYLVMGAVSGIARPADLLGHDYFQVTAVSDNRRGRLPHVAVSGV